MSRVYKKITLGNGLRIIAHNMSNRASVALGIWIKVGGRHESSEFKGISHFLEHLLFKGSRKYSCRKIKESIEGVGGALNGFTSEELTCYLVKIPASYLELALDILSSMVISPALPTHEIEKEKQVILEEIKMHKDLPQSYVYDLLDELLWPNQPLGAPIIGTVDSVSRISREDLHLFKCKYYTPSNIVISVAGALNLSKLTKSVKKIFSRQKRQNKNTFSRSREIQGAPGLKVFHKDTEQTHMALGFHSLERDHSLKHALGILHIILGANMSSRLFNELREKRGLAYDIGTQVRRLEDTGSFIVHAGIDNRKVVKALQVILKELKKVKEKLVAQDEFRRAKEFYKGQLAIGLEDTLEHMFWIGETTATLDKTYSLVDIIKEISRIKREDVREVAKQILQEKKMNLALIGSLKASEKQIQNQLNI
jgi:predicted Zn-dependent peptidase